MEVSLSFCFFSCLYLYKYTFNMDVAGLLGPFKTFLLIHSVRY